jgi:hypothetical protein
VEIIVIALFVSRYSSDETLGPGVWHIELPCQYLVVERTTERRGVYRRVGLISERVRCTTAQAEHFVLEQADPQIIYLV